MRLLPDFTRTVLGILFSPDDSAVTTFPDVLQCVNIVRRQRISVERLRNDDLRHTIK